jgi:hypothetical protein
VVHATLTILSVALAFSANIVMTMAKAILCAELVSKVLAVIIQAVGLLRMIMHSQFNLSKPAT